MADTQGTGKHPHKSTEEPWSHNKESQSKNKGEARSEASGNQENEQRRSRDRSQGDSTSNTQDLKSREYRDEQGNIHHHTHTAEAMKDRKAR